MNKLIISLIVIFILLTTVILVVKPSLHKPLTFAPQNTIVESIPQKASDTDVETQIVHVQQTQEEQGIQLAPQQDKLTQQNVKVSQIPQQIVEQKSIFQNFPSHVVNKNIKTKNKNYLRRVTTMPINLSKGQKVDLTKGNPGLKNIMVGLGWDVNAFDSGVDFDLDAAAFMLGADGKCPTDKEFVFYGNLKHASGSVNHMGDNLTGEGDGDDEQIQIDLSKVPANIEKIAFTVTIYDAETRHQNFGQVSNAFIRLVDEATNAELIRYDLGEDFSIETAVVVGELYRNNGEWKFNAIGSGFQGGLAALCGYYGIDVA